HSIRASAQVPAPGAITSMIEVQIRQGADRARPAWLTELFGTAPAGQSENSNGKTNPARIVRSVCATQLRTAQLAHDRLRSLSRCAGTISNARVVGLNTKRPQASVRSGAAQLTLTISGAIDVSATSPCVSKDLKGNEESRCRN